MFGFKTSTGITSRYLIFAMQVIIEMKNNVMLGFGFFFGVCLFLVLELFVCFILLGFLSLKSQLQREVEGVLWRIRTGSLMAAFLHGTICCCRNEAGRQLFMQIKCLTNPHEKVCTTLIRKKCSLMLIWRLFPE